MRVVYFIQSASGRIKIGTTRQLKSRLRSLIRQSGETLRVLAIIKGRYAEEKMLHQRFAHCRSYGEWFEPGDDLLSFIAAQGQPWDGEDERSRRLVQVRLTDDQHDCVARVAARIGLSVPDYVRMVVIQGARAADGTLQDA